MANIYKSSYTGAQVDSAIEKSLSIEANPSTTGTATLTKLKIGSMIYNVPQGSTSGGGDTTYRGTAITGTSTTATAFSNSGITAAKVGDWYINTNNGNVYQCTVAGNAATAKWVYKCTQAILESAEYMGVGIWGDDVSGQGAFLTINGYLDLIGGANYLCRISPDNVSMGNKTYYLPDNSNESDTFALANVISKTITAWPSGTGTVSVSFTTAENNSIVSYNCFQSVILKIGTSDSSFRYFYPVFNDNNLIYTFTTIDREYKIVITSGVGQLTYVKPAELAASNTFTSSNIFSTSVKIGGNSGCTISDSGLIGNTSNSMQLDFYNSTILFKDVRHSGYGTTLKADMAVGYGTTNVAITLPKKTGTLALTDYVTANPTADGTTALTKLKVGDTIYTLPTSGSGSGDVTAAGDNIFTGINTFEPTKLKVGGANSYYTFHIDNGSLNWSGIVGDSYRFPNVSLYVPTVPDTTANASQKTFHYQLPCKKEAAGSPVNIVTENEDNTFTGNNSFTNPITTTNASGFIIAPGANASNHKASIWVDSGTLSDGNISLEMVNSGIIATEEWTTAQLQELFTYANNTLTINI